MSNTVFCQKLKKEGKKIAFPPYPGELGKKIISNISQEAWEQWLGHQTILINEYRLSMLDQSARDFLKDEMSKFLFGDGSEKPGAFKPVSN